MSINADAERLNPGQARPDPAREAFLKRPLGGLIFRNALPAVASMLFMAFYQVTDGIMVGRRSFIEDSETIKKILVHLGLWMIRNHGPPSGRVNTQHNML